MIPVPIENVQEIWPAKMDLGRPNAEIGWKRASDQLLFLALYTPKGKGSSSMGTLGI